jgi:ABC-type multidrug transport system permease subunit
MAEALDRRSALWQLTITRLREFIREPEALFWVFVFPILMALALGLAFRTGSEPLVIVGVAAQAQAVGAAVEELEAAAGLEIRRLDPDRVESALRNGEVHVVLIPGSPPVYRFDPTRAESRLARLALDDALQRAAGRVDRFDPAEEPVVVRGSRYIDWLVPGLLGMNIMGSGVWSISFSVVLARSRWLLKQLVATPMRRRDYLLAQILSRLVFLGGEVGALLLFGWLVFDIALRGSVFAIGALAIVGAVAFSGLGLLVASRVRTIEAVSGLVNLVLLPMWVLSGVFFASSNFPDVMQPFIQALPLTALNDALRAVMLEGASLGQVGRQVGILAAWGCGSFIVALRLFSWR